MSLMRLHPQLLRKLCSCAAICAIAAGCNSGYEVSQGTTTASDRHPGLALTPQIVPNEGDVYEDVTAKAGLGFIHQFCGSRIANILQSNGSGVAILDFDNDGFQDIFLVNSGPLEGVTDRRAGTEREPNRLYRNKGDGTFEDVTEKAGVTGSGYGVAAAAADYDNDGFADLIVVNVGGSILYRNRGDGTFEDATVKAGITHSGTGIGAVFVDVDNDGHLDLFIANYLTFDPNYDLYFNPDGYPGPLSYKPELNMLFRNRGDGTFEDISERSGIRIPGHRGMSVAAFDYDKDGDQDLYICNDATPNLLLVNDGKGNFTEQALKHWVAFNAVGEAAGSMTAAIGDVNGDLIPDILVSRLGYGSLYIGSPQKVFSDQLMASGVGSITAQYVGWGSNFIDFDNDGDLDVFIANGDPHHLVGWESLLIKNNGEGKFTDAATIGGAFFRTKLRARGSAILDFDNDGRMDILVTAIGDRPFLLRNRGDYGNHWITLDLEGTRSNRDGFGSRITLHAGSKTFYTEARCPAGFLSTSDRRVHVGLGKNSVVDKLEIAWPSGTLQVLEKVPAGQILKIKEP
jgi:enediyne biosynthesis protein E4